jgi:hypothetical protein
MDWSVIAPADNAAAPAALSSPGRFIFEIFHSMRAAERRGRRDIAYCAGNPDRIRACCACSVYSAMRAKIKDSLGTEGFRDHRRAAPATCSTAIRTTLSNMGRSAVP